MSCDLEVDTDGIRHAARRLGALAELALGAGSGSVPAASETAGGSAIAREALRMVVTRCAQSLEACAATGRALAEADQGLSAASRAFDTAEALCAGGG